MSFSEKVQIVIETVSGNAKQGIDDFKTSVGDADTKTGKFKAGVGSLKDSFLSAATSPLGLTAAVGSAVAIGAKAVTQFEDTALSVDKFSTATGTSADQASRWVEVAGDLGVGADAVESAMGRMNKTAALTPGVFDEFGVSIAHAKDGSVDASQTFQNVIQRLGEIKDPTQQAEAGFKLLGKGWQSMAGLIAEGAPKLKQDLESVQASKIFNASDINAAKGVRDGFDAIKDAGEGLFLTLGKALAPAIAELAPEIGKVIDAVGPLVTAIGTSLADALENAAPLLETTATGVKDLAGAIELYQKSAKQWGDSIGDLKQLPDESQLHSAGDLWGDVAASISATGFATEDLGAANASLLTGQKDLNTQLIKSNAQAEIAAADMKHLADITGQAQAAAEAYQKAIGSSDWGAAALDGAVKGMEDFNAQHFALKDIQAQVEQSTDDFTAAVKKNGFTFDVTTQKGRDNQKALEDVADSLNTQFAAAYKDAGGNMDVFKDKADGISKDTLSTLQSQLHLSKGQTDDLAKALGLMPDDIETRYKLSGDEEAKQKIGLLQGAINDLPKDVQTKVTQEIIKGDYQGALADVQDYFNNHPVNAVIKYHNDIPSAPINKGGTSHAGATGGIVTRPTWSLIGEDGPEAVVPLNQAPGASPLPAGMGGSKGDTYVTINTGLDPRAVATALKTYVRTNGPLW